jgi:hypothetical protein
MTTTHVAAPQTPTTPSSPAVRRRTTRRVVAATAAAFLLAAGSGAGPLIATASAQSSALEQSLGGAAPQVQQAQQRATPSRAATGGTNLNASPDFSGPGISKGVSLIGYAKAACLVIGVLTQTIGIPISKALKEAGNHHASGIRSGVMGVGGSVLLAGVAGTLLPWLMA